MKVTTDGGRAWYDGVVVEPQGIAVRSSATEFDVTTAPRSSVATRSQRTLRVVRLYYHLEVGGIEARLVDLLPRLDRNLFSILVVCTRRRGTLAPAMERRGIPVRLCKCYSRLPLSVASLGLSRLLRKTHADIVHAHSEALAQAATVAARRAGTPVVVANFHNVQLFQRPGQVERERHQHAMRDAVIHVSEQAYRDYLERVRPAEDRGIVLYNGVDVARFGARPSGERLHDLERELETEGRRPLLLNVARLHRDKAHGVLFRAFGAVRERYPAAMLLLVGAGRRRAELEAEVRAQGLEGAVRFLGLREDLRDLYHLVDLHVLSSHREGFSNVVLEAMAAGTPQVLTDVGGNLEAVGDSEAALLVPPRDSRALARALLRVLDDPDLASALRDAAIRRVARFSIEEQVRRTQQLYLDLARRKGLV